MPHIVFERNNLLETPLKKGDIEFYLQPNLITQKIVIEKLNIKLLQKKKI